VQDVQRLVLEEALRRVAARGHHVGERAGVAGRSFATVAASAARRKREQQGKA
jgi:hypothetical protein